MTEKVATKPLKDYVVPADKDLQSSIVHPPIAANNFKFKPSLIGMIRRDQFSGLPMDNPTLYLFIFVDNGGMLKANDIGQNSIHLRLFLFALQDKARAWIQSLHVNSITS